MGLNPLRLKFIKQPQNHALLKPLSKIIFISILTSQLLAQEATLQQKPKENQPTPAQTKALQSFLKSPSLKTASVGFCLIPLTDLPKSDSPETRATFPKASPILQHNSHLALVPASTLKAVTTATALQILGKDHTFDTSLYLVGDNLIIKGGGDPVLASSSLNVEFPAWLSSIKSAFKEKDLTEIKGNLIADPTHFESNTTPNEWPWGDIGNYYGAGTSGLNFHQNAYRLTFSPGKPGAPAKLTSTLPTPPNVTFQNHIRTGTSYSGDQAYAYVSPNGSHITLRGTVPGARSSFSIKGALPNPPLSCSTALKSYLEKNGLPVKGTAKVASKPTTLSDSQRIHLQHSPPLHRLIIPTNQKSINLNAEAIFKALTKDGSATSSSKKIKAHWESQNIDMTGFNIQDGSGLSPRNPLTAQQLATILLRAHQHKTAPLFKKSLATAGRNGTLTSFGKGTAAEGRVIAKSGNLTRIRSYAGFLDTRSGKKYAFALLTNNHHTSTKAAIINLLAQLASH